MEARMEIQRISEFSNFLANAPKSFSAIAQFLVMQTFREEEFLSGFISELNENGIVHPIGGFGWSHEKFNAFPERQISSNSPITNSIRDNELIFFANDEAFDIEYPELLWSPPDGWASGVAIPVYPMGGAIFISSKAPGVDREKEMAYTAIGSLLGLYASRLPSQFVEEAKKIQEKIDIKRMPLTDRQLVIAGMLERGFSNAQIGLEIGYSESLIRQETVSIYKKLNVTGREAMQIIRALNLENLKSDNLGSPRVP
jgi:DNA-binding CsgD family transcriptional regulator